MRAVVQRVSRAEVRSSDDGHDTVLGRIGRGLCVLVGVGQGDTREDAAWLADKVAGLRIFADPDPEPAAGGEPAGAGEAAGAGGAGGAKKDMNRALADIGGGLLVISQFTLYADASKGRRPSFTGAMLPAQAIPLYEHFLERLRATGRPVETGRFGAMMAVELVNDGPVTIWLDSAEAPFRAAAAARARSGEI